MKRTEYFESSYEVAQHYPNGVPSTVIAIVGDGTNVFVSSDNSEGDKTQQYFSADLTNDEIVEQQVETAYTAGTSYGYEQGEAAGYETGYTAGYETGYTAGIASVPVPTGNVDITTTSQYDVTAYATAQVVDANLISANIVSGTSILGVQGSYEGGGIYPSGTEYIINTEPYDVTYYATAVVSDGYLLPENIKQGVTILGVSGSYEGGGITPSGNIDITTTSQYDVTSYATAQVSDDNLVGAYIIQGKSILGVQGQYEGIIPEGNVDIKDYHQYDVTAYRYAQISSPYFLAENIRDGVNLLGLTGTYTGLIPSGTAYINANTVTDVSAYAYAYCEASSSPVVDATVEILANQTSQLMFHDAWYVYIENHWDGRASEVLQQPNTYYSYVPYWAVNTLSDFGNDMQEFYVDKITPNGVVDITSYCYVTGSGANTYINYPNAYAGDKIGAGLYNIYTYIGDAQPIWLYDETTGSHWLEAQSDGTFSIGFGLDENSEAPGNYGDTGEDPGEDPGELGDCPYCEGTSVYNGEPCPVCGGSGRAPEGYRGETYNNDMIEVDGEPDPSYVEGYDQGWIDASNGTNENYDPENWDPEQSEHPYPYVAGYCAGQQDWANANVGGEGE